MKKQNKKVSPFKGISVMLDTMARMLITIVVLYILGTSTTPTTFQVYLIDGVMLYFCFIPIIDYVKEVFCNGA